MSFSILLGYSRNFFSSINGNRYSLFCLIQKIILLIEEEKVVGTQPLAETFFWQSYFGNPILVSSFCFPAASVTHFPFRFKNDNLHQKTVVALFP